MPRRRFAINAVFATQFFHALPKVEPVKPGKTKPAPKKQAKHDPRHLAAARDLRDRYLEKVNQDGYLLESLGKYEVSRAIAGATGEARPLLNAA